MPSQSRRRTLPLATALLALVLSAPAAPAIAAGNTSAQTPPPNFPTAVPTRPGALTQHAERHASATRPPLSGPPTWPTNPQPIAPARAANAPTSTGGVNWTAVALGSAGSLLAIAGLAAIARRNRRIKRGRVTA
jgi:hypothetical protein